MLGFVVRRGLAALFTMWLAATLAFGALRIVPGDAIAAQLGRSGATTQQIADRRAALGLDAPLVTQYLAMLGGLLRGDLGRSLISERPVAEMIGEQFGATAELAITALLIGTFVGLSVGLMAALAEHPLPRLAAWTFSALALSAPAYWTSTLTIAVFGVWLHGALPSAGAGDLRHLILPGAVLGFAVSGAIGKVTTASIRDTQRADFVRTARGKGLPERYIALRHILRASLPPIITVIALQFGFLLGGTVITETIFVRPGIGRVLINAINDHDYSVVQGIVILAAIVYSFTSAAADWLITAIDPHLRAN